MGAIKLIDIQKSYDGKEMVIPNLNLDIEDGSFTCLVGPSGCGKSTTLRMIAGLDAPTSGKIMIDGEDVSKIPPGKRGIAMVFQNYALYPTMTVRENIEFGLVNRKVPADERKRRVSEVSRIVGLTEYLDRKPANLSGGQRQRVALARAMVKKPKVFLMDEPLSNLDAKLRAQMRVELIQLHEQLGTTFIYVTHDQVEAMSMGSSIVLMHNGVIMQQSEPTKIYREPENVYTARFIGTPPMNILSHALPEGIQLGFRPEKIHFEKLENAYHLKVQILTREWLGAECIYSATCDYGAVSIKSADECMESEAVVSISYKDLYFFDKDSKRIPSSDNLFSMVEAISEK